MLCRLILPLSSTAVCAQLIGDVIEGCVSSSSPSFNCLDGTANQLTTTVSEVTGPGAE